MTVGTLDGVLVDTAPHPRRPLRRRPAIGRGTGPSAPCIGVGRGPALIRER
jgi:hypothetical protein